MSVCYYYCKIAMELNCLIFLIFFFFLPSLFLFLNYYFESCATYAKLAFKPQNFGDQTISQVRFYSTVIFSFEINCYRDLCIPNVGEKLN